MAKQKRSKKPESDELKPQPPADTAPDEVEEPVVDPGETEAGDPDAVPAKRVTKSSGVAQGKSVPVKIVKPNAGSTGANRKPLLLIIAGVVVLMLVVGVLYVSLSPKSPTATNQNTNGSTASTGEQLVPRLLDGTLTSSESAARWPIAVMIDNHPDARPQSALGLGRVVYETLAEGGATRFMAIFDGSENPERLGPVRSSRHYFVTLAEEYQAAYVHAGQSPQAAAQLLKSPVTDLNLIGSAGRYGYRGNDHVSPHNLYTDDKLLTFALRDKNLLEKRVEFRSWLFGPEPALEARPTTPLVITVKFSGGKSYESGWQYNREKNVFERSTGGQLHKDALTNEIISAKTVIVMRVPTETNLGEKGRLDIDVLGDGEAKIFQDGAVIDGRWTRKTSADRTIFSNAQGIELTFHPGPIWIEVVPGTREVVVTQPSG